MFKTLGWVCVNPSSCQPQRERERERERERTLDSLLLTIEENALQPHMCNFVNDFKHSRPRISTTFSQFARFSSCNLSKLERSDTLSNAVQLATFTSSKFEGSGGRDLSSLQSGNKSFLRLKRPDKLDGRLKKLL